MRKKKETNREPTPNLGLPMADRKFFTYAENKLLDQITTEIMTAWAKDLKTIRECQKETLKTTKQLVELRDLLSDIFRQVENDRFFPKLEKVLERQEANFQFMEDIRQQVFQTQEQVLGLREVIREALGRLKVEPKKWWEFWK